jgi:predicted O-methyltransferase YrrM
MSKMIQNPEAYFGDFLPPRNELLLSLEKEARKEGIPIVGPVVGELLYILARTAGAVRILELGTATGYSAIFLASACRSVDCRLMTMERNEAMAMHAKDNLAKAGFADMVKILIGDAIDLMASMEGPIDMIFMDIDKEHYKDALPHCHRLLRGGGLLVTDNVGFQGADDFNREIFSHAQWRVVNLYAFLPGHSPEKDGLSIAVRSD